ncbi:hypothetical protein ABT373_33430 [Streptomyces sp. NPDC000070]|uniref:hypothetical protein n=1 Tax=Streptomyces sp. NPDC000070 TaxID=3154240 RepID=UPI00331D1D5C
MGVRGSRGRQVFLAASAVVLRPCPPAHLAYVGLSIAVSAAAGYALRRITSAMAASRSKVWAERGRLLRERRRLLNRRLVQEQDAASPEAAELVRLGRQALAEVRALSGGRAARLMAGSLVDP